MNYQTNIKELRELKCISQEKLSEDSGVSLRTIQRIESGESTPRESTLTSIAETLGVTTDYLIYNPHEVITEEQEIYNKAPKKRFRFAWYRLSFTLIGISLGFLLFAYIVETGIAEEVDDVLPIPLMVLFGAIGLLVGNYLEKRNS